MPWRVLRGVLVGVVVTAAAALPARGDEPPEGPPPAFVAPPPGYEPGQPGGFAGGTPESLPGFMTLDRMDSQSRAGIQVAWTKIDAVSLSDGFVMRFEPYAQVLLPGRPVGFYGHLPFTHLFNFNGSDATGVGNLELGGFFLPMNNSDVILRVGLALSTASDSGNELIANVIAPPLDRLTDVLLVAPNYTTGRLSVSTFQRNGDFFFRADGGFDLVIDKPSTIANVPSVFFRANIGGGIRVQEVDLTAELVNFASVNGSTQSGIEQRFLHTLAVGVRTLGENQIHFGTVFGLDEITRGDYWVLSLGYQRVIN
jgi:hypothetical protein